MSAFAKGRNPMIRTFGTSLAILALGAACASTQERSEPAARTATTPPATEGQVVEITVTEEGFVPSPVRVREGEPLTLIVTRTTDRTCATEILIPAYDIEEELPLDQPVTITFTPTKSGEIKYGCGMGQMIAGVLVVE